MKSLVMTIALGAAICGSACSSVSSVRLQPEAIESGPGTRPVAGIQADAISFYFLFIPVPGVDLDQVINQMLVVTAKSMGADKVANLQFEMTPESGVWALRKLLGWRSATASGIAVQTTGTAPDPGALEGPETPLPAGPSGPPPAAEPESGTEQPDTVPET